jgi:hypothetical protein
MPIIALKTRAADLEQQIAAASDDLRPRLRAELRQVVEEMKARGESVSAHLASLDQALIDEEVEDQFDNMPI